MNKRILLISSNSSGRGGGERYLMYLTQGLHLLDYEVHVLLSTIDYMDGWANELNAEGAIVHRQHLLGLRQRPLRFFQSITDTKQQLEIAKLCEKIAPIAILINQQYDEDGLDYLAGAIKANIAPVGGTLHMPMTANKDKRPFGKWRGKVLQHWYQKHPYHLIFVSQGSKTEFENYYKCLGSKQVVNYGCPFSDIDIANAKIELPSNWTELPIVGFSGQLVPQKNLKLLVDSWLWTLEHGTRCRLLLIGDGEQSQEIKECLQATPKDMWHITGWQNHPEAYLSILDIYIMTSHYEGLPLALLEAVGRGIPAVVTNFNGASDVKQRADWVNIASASTVEAVGTALTKSLNQLPELKQQAKIGQQDFQSYFSLSRMASDTLAALGVA
jgi:glycosyltransferase involved in cell wall biosynthesis